MLFITVQFLFLDLQANTLGQGLGNFTYISKLASSLKIQLQTSLHVDPYVQTEIIFILSKFTQSGWKH